MPRRYRGGCRCIVGAEIAYSRELNRQRRGSENQVPRCCLLVGCSWPPAVPRPAEVRRGPIDRFASSISALRALSRLFSRSSATQKTGSSREFIGTSEPPYTACRKGRGAAPGVLGIAGTSADGLAVRISSTMDAIIAPFSTSTPTAGPLESVDEGRKRRAKANRVKNACLRCHRRKVRVGTTRQGPPC